jgi:hypothetical protein
MRKIILLLMFAASAAGCASTRAQVPEQAPTLVVPPVPPRTIEPLPRPEPVVEPVPDLPPATSAPPRARPPTRDPAKNATEKPEKVETPPETPPAPTQPVPPLRTPTGVDGPEGARQVREILDKTKATLDGVDFQTLNADRKANYRAVQGWIQQADEALKNDDINFAKSLAERAQATANQLAARK